MADGTEKIIEIDVTKFLSESQFEDGLQINTSGVVSTKIDSTSEEYLSVSPDGLKLSGINNAITTAVSTEETRAIGVEDGLNTRLTTLETIVSDNNTSLLNKLSIEEEARIDKDEELESSISTLSNSLSTLETKVNDDITNLSNEITRAEEKDKEHDTKIAALESSVGSTLNLVESGNGINVSEINENKQTISIKLNEDVTNALVNNENGLYLNNVWNCGTY